MSYAIGIDFGTESARALLVRTEDGAELASAVAPYSHGVIHECLPAPDSDVRLPPLWALQHPLDYLETIGCVVLGVLNEARVSGRDVVGLGIDFTSCTALPVDGEGLPLCIQERWRRNPHAWVKLWKHHAAQREADEITRVLAERDPELLSQYGGRVSSEWLFPKLLETARHAPDVFDAAASYVEAADWLVWRLTGELVRSACTCGFKGLWAGGYPSNSILEAVSSSFRGVESKLSEPVLPVGGCAGRLNRTGAELTGLREGTPVAVPVIDAHASVVGSGVAGPGRMVLVMGTSICQMLLSPEKKCVAGIAGVVKDSIVPGLYAYEAGQPSLGDTLAWCVRVMGRSELVDEASFAGLEYGASLIDGGRSGLLVLDWWNGNRSILDDSELGGVILGLRLDTTSAAIYRAVMEGCAFGSRVIMKALEEAGLDISEVIACGGIAEKSPLLLQIYADVTGRVISTARSSYTSALGAAIYGAVAGGAFSTVDEAAAAMASGEPLRYEPHRNARRAYEPLYRDYQELYEYFGRRNDVLKRLSAASR